MNEDEVLETETQSESDSESDTGSQEETVENEQTDNNSVEQQEENEETDNIEQQEEITNEDTVGETFEFFNPFEEQEKVLLIDRGESGSELIKMITDVTFTDIFPYLIPVFFLFVVFLFSDTIIDLIYKAIGVGRRRR